MLRVRSRSVTGPDVAADNEHRQAEEKNVTDQQKTLLAGLDNRDREKKDM